MDQPTVTVHSCGITRSILTSEAPAANLLESDKKTAIFLPLQFVTVIGCLSIAIKNTLWRFYFL